MSDGSDCDDFSASEAKEGKEGNELIMGDIDDSCECCCCTWYKFKIYVLFFIFFVSTFFVNYFIGVGLLNVVFYPQVYQWISLFEKSSPVHICFTVFGIISDFGYSYLLFLMALVISKGTIDNIYKQISTTKETFIDGNMKLKPCFLATYISLTVFFVIIVVLCFVFEYAIFYVIVIFLPLTFFGMSIFGCITSCYTYCAEDTVSLQFISLYFPQFKDFFASNIANRENEDKECCSSRLFYIPVFLFILMGQIYNMTVAGMKFKDVGATERAGICIGIIIRIVMLPRLFDLNLFDTIFNFKRTFYVITDKDLEKKKKELENCGLSIDELKKQVELCKDNPYVNQEQLKQARGAIEIMEKAQKNFDEKTLDKVISFGMASVLFIAGSISLIVLSIYVTLKKMPNVTNVAYEKNSEYWIRTKAGAAVPTKPFCKITPDLTSSFGIDDIAMLTVLPRLYKIHNGKCFIKPKLRGVFNSTMRYIFGQYYENDKITIMCNSRAHFPYLVISSEKFTNQLETQYDPQNITALPEQFAAESNDFFSDIDSLDSKRAENELIELKTCISKGGTCYEEWDEYTKKYWESYDIDSNEQLPGLEQYQINIDDDVVIQPSFITNDGEKLSGTHFIVGGGFEDRYGYGFLIENTVRVYLPYILENFIPLYSWATSLFRNPLNRLTKFTYYFLYAEYFGSSEVKELSHLLTKFNMSNEALFMVGHSISGATIKELSYITDIKGIAFESSNGRGIASSAADESFVQMSDMTNKVANIYSDGMLLSDYDSDFEINGMLPKHFYNPNVYDTACQVVVSCSETYKYAPFCKQVLTQGGSDPVKEFEEIIESFNKSD